jgi:2-C-methyl-D-erythritol 4-phosphate cytidylyltransferase/2-C-methyl-D-erythritol 2,4-cyclodiphosphate synthase
MQAPARSTAIEATAIVAAAGRGERLRAPQNKAFVQLAGRPLVSYALETFRGCPGIAEIILVVAPEDVERARQLLRAGAGQTERVVAGGALRQESVAAALAEVRPGIDLVAIHDAARPFVKRDLIQRCLEQAARCGAAVAAAQATDTVKQADPDGTVTSTLDRSRIWLVQTPQVFRRALLEEAHRSAAAAGVTGTDDAALVERLGHPVHLVEGDVDNIKITFPEDVVRSEQALARGRSMLSARETMRCGIGYDAHRFAEDRPLVLAGIRLREERGLLGHSDADVVCHAACDALLGAIAAGDIGRHFPDSDPAYRGASSLSLLQRVAAVVRSAGWQLENMDIVVIAEEPRIAPHIEEMRRVLAEAIGSEAARISLKGKTTEGMGFTGRGEGIAAQAIATVRPLHHRRTRAKSEE